LVLVPGKRVVKVHVDTANDPVFHSARTRHMQKLKEGKEKDKVDTGAVSPASQPPQETVQVPQLHNATNGTNVGQ